MERRRELETRRLATIVVLFCAGAIPLLAVGGCGKQLARMEENQIKLEAMVAANARELATISSQLHTGQGKINESIQTLDGDTRQVAAGVVSVQNEQRQLHDAVAAGNEGLNRRIGYVEDNQRSLQGSVAQVSDVTQRTAADLTSLAQEHTALRETVRTNQQELAGSLGTVVDNQQAIQTGIGNLRQASEGLAGGIASIAAKHDTLYAAVRDNGKQLSDRLAVLSSGHERLCADIVNVHTLLQTMAADLVAANSSLKEQLGTNHESLAAQIAGLSASQQRLQAGVDTLGGKADQAAVELADTRSSLQDTLRVSREVLTGQIAASLQNQQALHSDVRNLSDKADKLTADIGEVSTGQAALRDTLRTNHDAVITAMAGLSERHDALRSGIGRLDGKADRVAGDIASMTTQQQAFKSEIDNLGQATQRVASDIAVMASGQKLLHQTLRAHTDQINEQVMSLANSQEEMKANLDTLTAATGQASLDILALGNGQTGLTRTVQTGVADLGMRTDKMAAELTAVAAGQNSLHDAMNRHGQAVSSQVARVVDGQQQMQSSLDTLTATAGQTALDVIAMTTRQDAIQAALQSHNEALDSQVAKLADNQQQIQNGLDTVTATTGQASLDALALHNSQGQLGQAVQAGRQEMVATLATMAQGQQSWSDRLNSAQAKVATLADSIAALKQQVAKLQEVLQTGIQGTTTVLGATGQQQLQFEAKVSQDMQAVIDALAQLHQTQTSLQEQITQVQKSTQGQAESIRSAIGQMKGIPNVLERTDGPEPKQPHAEVRISDAAEIPQAPEVPEAAE
jgi:chromosome segregation ATPase